MIVYTSKHKAIELEEKPVASGGEGSIYKVISSSSNLKGKCVKIYHDHKLDKRREDRIKFMVENPPKQIHGDGFLLGWPIEWVTDEKGKFLGFAMPMAFSGSRELVALTATTISKKLGREWHDRYDRNLGKKAILSRLKLMVNIAIPVHILHLTGKYVLKDFKPQNVLATADGRITMVDMDSIQIADDNRLLFPGTAATQEYMPPEFFRKGIGGNAGDVITPTWDTFALGVVFYQLLFGIHPYVVTPKVQQEDGTNSISHNIALGLFPFGENRDKVKVRPTLHNGFKQLPDEFQKLFIRTFSDDLIHRPSADEWGRLIYQEIMKMEKIGGGIGDLPPAPPVPPTPAKKGYKWIIPLLVILGLSYVGYNFYLNKADDSNYVSQEPAFSDHVRDFVNFVADSAAYFDTNDWKECSGRYDFMMHEYAVNYNNLSTEELDLVDEAIDLYNTIYRKYREIPFEEDTTKIVTDGIEYLYEKPTIEQLVEWENTYSGLCSRKVANMEGKNDFSIPEDMLDDHPCLVYLLLKANEFSRSWRDSLFGMFPIMDDEDIARLYSIYYKHRYIQGKINKKYEIKERAKKFNSEAYDYARRADFYNAKMSIEKAKLLVPDEADYYDSEGEFCLMQNRQDRALSLWNKVMELDPNFLDKHNGSTELYKQLKEKGLLTQ